MSTTEQPSASGASTHDTAKEAPKPPKNDIQALKDEITSYKTLSDQLEQQIERLSHEVDKHEVEMAGVKDSVRVIREETGSQNSQLEEKLGNEADGVNSRVGNLEQSLKVLREETETRLREEVDNITLAVDRDMKQKVSEMEEAYARLNMRVDEGERRVQDMEGLTEGMEVEMMEKLKQELKDEIGTEIANRPHPASIEPIETNTSEPPKRRRICFCF